MSKYLLIAGHGPRKNGTFDPGARGRISKGEYRYMKEDLFPAMKKFAGNDFIFFTDYNVFSYANIVALARRYGVNIKVVEFHYDALNGQARGGHVIIHSDYGPDAMDLRLRDAIGSMVGLRFSHRGYKGISGRSNLANVNRTRHGGVNYRLIELGFGDNKTDAGILTGKIDEYAKKLVNAISGKQSSFTPSKPSQPSTPKPFVKPKPNKSTNVVAREVIAGSWGNGSARERNLRNAGYNPSTVQAEVNRVLGAPSIPKPTPKPKLKSISTIAGEVMAGSWGNGTDRTDRLKRAGYNPSSIQAEVNRQLGATSKPKPAPKPKLKSTSVIAREVMAGSWGNGTDRTNRLKRAGYNPSTIQAEVNRQAGNHSAPNLKSNAAVARDIYNGKGNWGTGSTRSSRLKAAGYNPQAVQNEVNKLF